MPQACFRLRSGAASAAGTAQPPLERALPSYTPCMARAPLREMNGHGGAYAATNGSDAFSSFGAAPTAADMSLFDDSSHYSSVAFPAPSAPPARSPPAAAPAPATQPPTRRLSLSAPDPQVTVADPQVCDQANVVAVPGAPTHPCAPLAPHESTQPYAAPLNSSLPTRNTARLHARCSAPPPGRTCPRARAASRPGYPTSPF